MGDEAVKRSRKVRLGAVLVRAVTGSSTVSIWADDRATGKRRNLTAEEGRAFWAWATVEVLRSTGIRAEELVQLSHHSFVQYRLPGTGELVPLLQIVPSKTDAERLLVISPELADVLSAIITRIRGTHRAVPLVAAYDDHERLWLPAAPVLFQRRIGAENRAIPAATIRKILAGALARTGLTDPAGAPLHYTPHDFRRMFLPDAIMNGLPPHIAQIIAGHRDINVTLGYKAVYPHEAIQAHLAFLARRRALRPTEEYRTPTDAEWDEFLGHFERRKVATGTCGRAFAPPTAASAAPCTGPTPPSATASPRSAITSPPASPKPTVKAGPAKPKDSRSASPAPKTSSPRSTGAPPPAPPSDSECPHSPPAPPRTEHRKPAHNMIIFLVQRMPMSGFAAVLAEPYAGKYRESCWITFGKTQPAAARTGLITWCRCRGASSAPAT
jgi:Phage integrase family